MSLCVRCRRDTLKKYDTCAALAHETENMTLDRVTGFSLSTLSQTALYFYLVRGSTAYKSLPLNDPPAPPRRRGRSARSIGTSQMPL